MFTQKGNILTLIAIFIALIFVASASFYAGSKYFSLQNETLNILENIDNIEKPQNTPTPTPQDEIANWKTYTSNKYGYSFKYPSEFVVKETEVGFDNNKYPELLITDKKTGLQLTASIKLEYGITELGYKPGEYTIAATNPMLIRTEDGFKNQWTYYQKQDGGECYSSKENKQIQNGYHGIDCFNVNFPFNWVYTLNSIGGTPFNFQQGQTEEKFKLFDQILSTFRFTN